VEWSKVDINHKYILKKNCLTHIVVCYSRWIEELRKSQVLVMTYSIFLEVMEKNYLKMNELNLLILDECHNVMNNEDLKGVLTLYENFAKSEHPRILGLTASIVNNKCKPMELSQLITILETKLKSVISTSNSVLSALQ
jgi:endoribonuclease Dicer